MKFNTIIKLVCAVSLLAAGLTAAPMESVKDEEVAPSTPAVTLPDASAMPVVEVAEEEDDEDDNSSLLVETGVDAPVSIVTETADKPLPVTPAAGQTTTQLVLASKEDVANARSNAVVAFKHTWDPLTRIITADFVGLDGPRTFFKADKHHFFVLQEETASLVSNAPPYVDYNAYDLQTGELVTLRTRQKYEFNGMDIIYEAVCNNAMSYLVHDYFKSSNIIGSKWVVLRTAATAPTARQVLERGRENAPEHLLPATLYQTAAKELAKLHKVFLYHGYVRLSNFKVDEATGAVNLINYQFCGDSLAGIYDDISAQILASEKKKLFNLFSDYMTEEEINEVKIE